ncbi:MAG: kinase/pyrophosphorylase, partial [Methyloversatilis sp.]|nr:kinase/pyrophosphorylase [Methyloversatilis sp.]
MRTVFFISDSTGITAETLGRSLLSQFEGVKFRHTRVPFVDSVDNALDCVERITESQMRDGVRPIVVTSIVNAEVARTVRQADALFLDLFEHFVGPLEDELGQAANHNVGRQKGAEESADYQNRIEAINFSLAHDDGMS